MTEYHVYANDGHGGPVDYSTPIATVSGLSYATSALAASSDTTFAVRAFDTVSGLEESNVDARVRIVLDGSSADVSGVPASPKLLGAIPGPGGTARVDWAWLAAGRPAAASFAVYLSSGATLSYATPAATVSVVPGVSRYSTTLSGLSGGTPYVVGVRAINAAGGDGNTASLPITGPASAPSGVDNLAAVAVMTH